MQVKDPKPEISRLEELALQVKSGDIKLPRFQRPFVWKESDMLMLLDSIYKGYPIGSILIWNSSQQLTSERSISGLTVNIEDNSYFPTNYLLDGQQRLTTLCGALFWDGNDPSSIWNIHFDLEEEKFVRPKEPNLVNLFPLNKLIQTGDFIQQCMKFQHHSSGDKYIRVAERLLKSIKDYKIAVVKIGDMTIDEVAPIFERINSTGRKLTMVDLMMAATWSAGFDLAAAIADISETGSTLGFDGINENIVLRSISASADLGINKEDIQRLRAKSPDELTRAASSAKRSILAAVSFLQAEVGIEDYSYIPYGFQFTYLTEFFRLVKEPSAEARRHLVEWFWFTSITRYFGTSNTGQVTKDLARMRDYANKNIASLFDVHEIDISKLLYDKFNLRNATSTTFTVLLNNLNPKCTLEGLPIDGSHLKIKSNRLFGAYCPYNGKLELLNISKVIYPFTPPRNGLASLQPISPLEPHLIDATCVADVHAGDVRGYLIHRANIIAERVKMLTGCSVKFSYPDTALADEPAEDELSDEASKQ